jgi:hypothetical protein
MHRTCAASSARWSGQPGSTSAWTRRELRHSFVSLMPNAGVPVEHIARLAGHSGTTTSVVGRTAQGSVETSPVLLMGAGSLPWKITVQSGACARLPHYPIPAGHIGHRRALIQDFQHRPVPLPGHTQLHQHTRPLLRPLIDRRQAPRQASSGPAMDLATVLIGRQSPGTVHDFIAFATASRMPRTYSNASSIDTAAWLATSGLSRGPSTVTRNT